MNVMSMTPKEIAQDLVRLTENRPSSGNLRKINKALDGYRNKGYGDLLDALLAGFEAGTEAYVGRVQRGYAGTSEWVQLREAASRLAPALEVIGKLKENAS